jgi:hypothetical protein
MLIMHALAPLLFFLAQPFWEARPPERWTNAEIELIRTSSPWAQVLSRGVPVTVFLATALPIEHAEAELRLRARKNPHPMPEPDPDYLEYLTDHREDSLVLGVTYPRLNNFDKAGEAGRMERETAMVIGRQEYPIMGYFPPTASDPVLRLIFPRLARPAHKTIVFRLYLPGLTFPEREATFTVKDLTYQGRLEM